MRRSAGGARRGGGVVARWRRPARLGALGAVLLAGAWPADGRAQGACPGGADAVGRLVSARGPISVGGRPIADPARDVPVCPGEVVVVDAQGRAELFLPGARTAVRIEENSALRVEAAGVAGDGGTAIGLVRGAIHFLSRVRRSLTVATPVVTAGIEGTEVHLALDPRPGVAAEVAVVEGQVALRAPAPGVALPAPTLETGDRATLLRSPRGGGGGGALGALERGLPPGAVFRTTLAWTLAYPEVLGPAELALDPRLAAAAARLRVGQAGDADAALAGVPGGGRAGAARDALRAAIAAGQYRAADAAALAEAAVAAAPDLAAAHVARSYGRQLGADIDGARDAAAEAARLDPASALARARLAEVELMRGDRRAAARAAEAAGRLGDNALVRTVQGYVALAGFEAAKAEALFEAALRLDPESPQAHLGLGLARVRAGRLEAGREDLEHAALHDPAGALYRTNLSRAYLEEGRDPRAGDQLALAKALDPTDPNPWLADAIRKQFGNRPVEAWGDAERSIELNDNRAAFRSRLLLGEDRAARGAALGRIYTDLGFRQLGVNAASEALAADPASAASHRFLAEVYATRERQEVARISEDYQALMLQRPTRDPVPPSGAFRDLRQPLDLGPGRVSFGEYNALFDRDGAQLALSGTLGNLGTRGEEAIASARFGRIALSAGQATFRTDGFRPNNEVDSRLYRAFAQASVTPELDVQAEIRGRDTDEGDVALDFAPSAFSREAENEIEERVARLGVRYEPRPGVILLSSAIDARRDDEERDDFFPGIPFEAETSLDGRLVELQSILALGGTARLTLGGGRGDLRDRQDLIFPTLCGLQPCSFPTRTRGDQNYGYGYLDWTPDRRFSLRLGLSLDSYHDEAIDVDRPNPKLGVTLRPVSWLQLRAAATRSVRRNIVGDQTLEPTQLAGFGQLFDDPVGTSVDRVGLGLDLRLGPRLAVGAEASARWLEVAARVDGDEHEATLLDFEEREARAYLYYAPADRVALSAEYLFERFELEEPDSGSAMPTETRTHWAPVSLGYFDPSGLFGQVRATGVHQAVEFEAERPNAGSDWGVLLDALVGYRLPQGRGRLTLEARNLLDRNIRFQDQNFVTAETVSPRFYPEFTVLARVSVSFGPGPILPTWRND